MSVRVRWFGLALVGVPLRRVADEMLKLEYTRRRSRGFRVEEVRRQHVSGRFIERVEWDDTIEDPAGGNLEIHRVELRQIRFRLESDAPELQLSDAPRSLGSFVELLSDCTGSTAMRSVAIPLPDWIAELEKVTGRVNVQGLTATGLTLSSSTSASVKLAGTEDVRPHLGQFSTGRKLTIEQATVELPAPYNGRVDLSIGGRAVIRDGNESAIVVVREALRAAFARSTPTA